MPRLKKSVKARLVNLQKWQKSRITTDESSVVETVGGEIGAAGSQAAETGAMETAAIETGAIQTEAAEAIIADKPEAIESWIWIDDIRAH